MQASGLMLDAGSLGQNKGLWIRIWIVILEISGSRFAINKPDSDLQQCWKVFFVLKCVHFQRLLSSSPNEKKDKYSCNMWRRKSWQNCTCFLFTFEFFQNIKWVSLYFSRSTKVCGINQVQLWCILHDILPLLSFPLPCFFLSTLFIGSTEIS